MISVPPILDEGNVRVSDGSCFSGLHLMPITSLSVFGQTSHFNPLAACAKARMALI
jgi:hypothetical protein